MERSTLEHSNTGTLMYHRNCLASPPPKKKVVAEDEDEEDETWVCPTCSSSKSSTTSTASTTSTTSTPSQTPSPTTQTITCGWCNTNFNSKTEHAFHVQQASCRRAEYEDELLEEADKVRREQHEERMWILDSELNDENRGNKQMRRSRRVRGIVLSLSLKISEYFNQKTNTRNTNAGTSTQQ